MAQASTIGLDLAKNVFQVYGIDAEGKVVVLRRMRLHTTILPTVSTPTSLHDVLPRSMPMMEN